MTDTKPPATPWKSKVVYTRFVPCKRDGCDYMALEKWEFGQDEGSGMCSKCFHHWPVPQKELPR